MTPEAMAALHALAFTDTPRPWTAAEFGLLLGEPSTLLAVRTEGFAVGRLAGPEAELLTLAVHPAARRRGHGAALVAAFEAAAAARGAEVAFLEVAATNVPGRALYARLGYSPAGRRPGYYARTGAPPVDALLLSKRLVPSREKPFDGSEPKPLLTHANGPAGRRAGDAAGSARRGRGDFWEEGQ